MKVIIIGGGLTGLYIGYLFKKHNIDFEIYEKSNRPGGRIKTLNLLNTNLECGANYFLPYHFNLISLVKKLNLDIEVFNGQKLISLSQPDLSNLTNLSQPNLTNLSQPNLTNLSQPNLTNLIQSNLTKPINERFDQILELILKTYKASKPKNISASIYFQTILSASDYDLFKSHLFIEESLNNEISVFMEYLFYDLQLSYHPMCLNLEADILSSNIYKPNCAKYQHLKIKNGMQLITDKLASMVQEKLNLGYTLQEINYMPFTNSYVLRINNNLIQADKLILATNASIQNIQLNIPNLIKKQIFGIRPIKQMSLYICFHNDLSNVSDSIIQTQSIMTNIHKIKPNILYCTYISGSKNDLLYNLLSGKSTLKSNDEINDILHKLLSNIYSNITLIRS